MSVSSTTHDVRVGRRGIALLLVLAALVLCTSSAVLLAGIASTVRTARDDADAHEMALTLLAGAEPAALAWLERRSPRVVLPASARTPEAPVMYERVRIAGREAEITLTAYDQLGMLPLHAASSASPLRAALPHDIVERLPARPRTAEIPGLDLFEPALAPVFPVPSTHGSLRRVHESTDARSAIGAHIATHNPLPPLSVGQRARPDAGAINVNTAPLPLIEAALRQAGRGGIEVIRANRSRGEPTPLGALPLRPPIAGDQGPTGATPRLVGVSPTWSIRTDIRIGRARFAWWTVYIQSASGWEAVQRCVATD